MRSFNLCLLLVLGAAVAVSAQTCTNKSAYVGFAGPITTVDHEIGGNMTLTSDCAFKIEKFTYDGMAPTTFWHCAKSLDKKDLRASVRASDQQLKEPAKGITITYQLNKGISFDMCPVLVAWCETAKANFGYIMLKPAAKKMMMG